MATYTYYWPQRLCDEARALGLEGRPLDVFFGGENAEADFLRFKVGPGDTVIAITVAGGDLFLLASLVVREKALTADWLARRGDAGPAWRSGPQVLAGEARAPLSFGRRVPPALLASWRFDSGKEGRPIKSLEGGKVRRILSIHGVFRLTPATAAALAPLLEGPVAPPAGARADALLARLAAVPDDRGAASVLADLWQEAGDVRGEMLSLELALHAAPPAEQPALWARLDALARKRTSREALARPGGFPFRGAWTHRDTVAWHAWVPDRAILSLDEAERALAGWAAVTGYRGVAPPCALDRDAAARAAEDVSLSLALLHPETGEPMAFQSKRLCPLGSELQLGRRRPGRQLRCELPFTDDGPALRAFLAAARRALGLAPGHERLERRRWRGRAVTIEPLEP